MPQVTEHNRFIPKKYLLNIQFRIIIYSSVLWAPCVFPGSYYHWITRLCAGSDKPDYALYFVSKSGSGVVVANILREDVSKFQSSKVPKV
jgi:hypothetical protein